MQSVSNIQASGDLREGALPSCPVPDQCFNRQESIENATSAVTWLWHGTYSGPIAGFPVRGDSRYGCQVLRSII